MNPTTVKKMLWKEWGHIEMKKKHYGKQWKARVSVLKNAQYSKTGLFQ